MNRQDVHIMIGEITEKINRLNSNLKGSQKLHTVEVDLLKTYIGELNILVSALVKAESSAAARPEEPATKEKEAPEPKLERPVVEEEPKPAPVEPPKATVSQSPEPPAPAPKEEKPAPAVQRTAAAAPEQKAAPATSEQGTPSSLHDRFKKEKIDDLAERHKNRKIENLRDSIALSEKYEFISELFNGNADHFDKSLRRLNQCGSLEEAMSFVETELKGRYDWNEKGQYEKRFNALLARRFPAN